MPPIELRSSRAVMVFVLLGSLGFVAACVGLAITRGSEPGLPIVVATGILFFGACAVVGGAELINPRVHLRIDDEAIEATLRWPNTSFRIRYSEIGAMGIAKVKGQTFVVIVPKDPGFGMEGTTGLQRQVQLANYRLVEGWMIISPQMFGIKQDQLANSILERWEVHAGPIIDLAEAQADSPALWLRGWTFQP